MKTIVWVFEERTTQDQTKTTKQSDWINLRGKKELTESRTSCLRISQSLMVGVLVCFSVSVCVWACAWALNRASFFLFAFHRVHKLLNEMENQSDGSETRRNKTAFQRVPNSIGNAVIVLTMNIVHKNDFKLILQSIGNCFYNESEIYERIDQHKHLDTHTPHSNAHSPLLSFAAISRITSRARRNLYFHRSPYTFIDGNKVFCPIANRTQQIHGAYDIYHHHLSAGDKNQSVCHHTWEWPELGFAIWMRCPPKCFP